MRIGVISDTHNYFDPAIPKIFEGVDHILHAGDVGLMTIIYELESIAPVTAVFGNTDTDLPIKETEVIELGGKLGLSLPNTKAVYAGVKLLEEAGRAKRSTTA